MSEYLHVERPFLDQLATLGWTVIDQGHGFIPSDPTASLRESFREHGGVGPRKVVDPAAIIRKRKASARLIVRFSRHKLRDFRV